MSNESILKSIEDEETTIASLEVGLLSDLEPSSAAIISDSLSSLSLEREKQLLDHLINVSEDRFDVNFDELFARKLQSERPEIRELSIKGLWECNERSLHRGPGGPRLFRWGPRDPERKEKPYHASLPG